MGWKLAADSKPRDRRMPGDPRALIALTITLLTASLAVLAFAASSVLAAFPGGNGKIAFTTNRDGNYEIYTMNADAEYPSPAPTTRLTNNTASDVSPAWSSDGTKIAFTSNRDGNNEIYTMNADGTGQTRLTNNTTVDSQPAWSPDGTKIAFGSDRTGIDNIYTMHADGTGQTRLTNNAANYSQPVWSPNGDKIAFVTGIAPGDDIYTMNADGTGLTQLTNGGGNFAPAWSRDGTKIAFTSGVRRFDDIFTMNADGTGMTQLTSNSAADEFPAWSPDGTRIAFTTDRDNGDYEIYAMHADGTPVASPRLTNDPAVDSEPDWQPVTNNYARPKAATPIRIALVPAYKQCTNTNTRHKGALSIVSCNPPKPESGYLTVGTPDFNGQTANAVGYIDMKAFCNGGGANEQPPCSTTPGDQLDAKVTTSQTDVRCQASGTNCAGGPLSDYAGSLMLIFYARITDKNSGGNGSATVLDITFGHAVTCATTPADTTVGSTCSDVTSFDALLGGPSVITELKRAIWDLDDVKVYDGGADGVASTQGDNTLFESGGLFLP